MNKNKYFYFMILGYIIFIHSAVMILFVNTFNFGTVIPLVLSILLIYSFYFSKTLFYKNNRQLIKKYFFIVKILFLIWLVSFLVLMYFIFSTISTENIKEPELIFVLGGGIRNGEPNNILRERLEKALEYSYKYPDLDIYVSGGMGIGEDVTEAEAMKNYLIKEGVKSSRIFKEEKATSTYENVVFLKDILLEKYNNIEDYNNIILVTSDFHMYRSKKIAKRLGFKPIGVSARIPFYLYPNVCIREYIAIIKTNIIDF